MSTRFSLFFPISVLALAISTTSQASTFSMPDDDIEKAISSTLFTKVDVDKDGKVSLDEIINFRMLEEKKRSEERADEMLAQCDKNKDGKIGGDELQKFSIDEYIPTEPTDPNDCRVPEEVLDMMDTNSDGFISRKEVIEGSMQHHRPPKKIADKLKKKQDERMKKYQKEQFERCDKDKNEYLTLREAASMNCMIYTEMFDARDKNTDSLISLEEMMADVKAPVYEGPEGEQPDMGDYEMPASVKLNMLLSTCDKNDNGKLELSETASKECEVEMSLFNASDHNSDGAIDYTETRRLGIKDTFDELDLNSDGWLDKKEFKGSRIRYM